MLSNDNAFLNTYASNPNTTTKLNPFDQRTLFARFKVNTNNAPGTKYIEIKNNINYFHTYYLNNFI